MPVLGRRIVGLRAGWGRLLCALGLAGNAVAFILNLNGWIRWGNRWCAMGMVVGVLGVLAGAVGLSARAAR